MALVPDCHCPHLDHNGRCRLALHEVRILRAQLGKLHQQLLSVTHERDRLKSAWLARDYREDEQERRERQRRRANRVP